MSSTLVHYILLQIWKMSWEVSVSMASLRSSLWINFHGFSHKLSVALFKKNIILIFCLFRTGVSSFLWMSLILRSTILVKLLICIKDLHDYITAVYL